MKQNQNWTALKKETLARIKNPQTPRTNFGFEKHKKNPTLKQNAFTWETREPKRRNPKTEILGLRLKSFEFFHFVNCLSLINSQLLSLLFQQTHTNSCPIISLLSPNFYHLSVCGTNHYSPCGYTHLTLVGPSLIARSRFISLRSINCLQLSLPFYPSKAHAESALWVVMSFLVRTVGCSRLFWRFYPCLKS